MMLGPGRVWASQAQARPTGCHCFTPLVSLASSHAFSTPDGTVTFQKCSLVLLPSCQNLSGAPCLLLSEKNLSSSPCSSGPTCCVSDPPWLATRAFPSCSHGNLASRRCGARPSHRAFACTVLTVWSILSSICLQTHRRACLRFTTALQDSRRQVPQNLAPLFPNAVLGLRGCSSGRLLRERPFPSGL